MARGYLFQQRKSGSEQLVGHLEMARTWRARFQRIGDSGLERSDAGGGYLELSDSRGPETVFAEGASQDGAGGFGSLAVDLGEPDSFFARHGGPFFSVEKTQTGYPEISKLVFRASHLQQILAVHPFRADGVHVVVRDRVDELAAEQPGLG